MDRLGRCKRPKIIAATAARAAMLHDLRRCVIASDEDVGERLVVPHEHVEAGAQPLDQIRFEQQRLGLGCCGDEFERGRRRDHSFDAGIVTGRSAIGDHTLLDVLGLADIEDLARGIEHAVHAGGGRSVLGVDDDGRAAGGERAREVGQVDSRLDLRQG